MKLRTKIILWTLPILVIVVSFLYLFVIYSGLNVPWKMVGKPSENISTILGFSSGKLFVETDSGEMYSIDYYHYGYSIPSPDQWAKDKNYEKELDPIYGSNHVPYTYATPPQSFNVKQVYQLEFPATESFNVTLFVLSEDGNLWYWRNAAGGLQYFFYFLIIASEILLYGLALFIGLVIFLTKRIKRNSKQKIP